MFGKVLVANRGEIALRIARTLRELGIRSVGVYSSADRDERLRRHFDESVHIGPSAVGRSYQNVAAIVEAALQTGCDAVHPGYGFLSEDPDFAEVCAEAGLTFVGPDPQQMARLGDKSSARALMRSAGLPLLPGSVQPVDSVEAAREVAARAGYPVIIKAVAGGGGKGMAVVRRPEELDESFPHARAAARSVFGDDRVYLERYLEQARHVEVQILCDGRGNGVHLGTRDCSVQRRHQKLIEEGPAPALSAETLAAITSASVRAALEVGYTGVGTLEFLVDADESFYFMEINTRIQVEHPVTEMITGVDLIREQLLVAAGLTVQLRQAEIVPRGVSVECRVNGEDPDRDFIPTPGRLVVFQPPGGPFTRVDTHAYPGYELGPHYDSLLAKVVVWAPDREQALDRMDRALAEFDIEGPGVRTTIPFLRRVIADPQFRKAEHSTQLVDRIRQDDRLRTAGTGQPAADRNRPAAAPGRKGENQ
ncbi:acetyl/propionyl/methylcrotonyl-CoA carboxylase subunit alpha [Plantactinospora sp. KBS50]|uniref:acetyl-CoA carboxylase biotin carboxylase subunit n=1 Tax=Plantactinospora sp. KBS50 TaxID=2024580 RepID=UPI000BAA9DB3|nr:acetyl-CoA carboxylase biotin carboxylase subunit [Plantactinospora sp. KBS50]ASW58006.1 pyruvate carboxylase subunit A [Plantactinospora sp. KBS50]